MRGAEPPDLIQFDVGVLRLGYGGASDPPAGAGQAGRHIGPGSRLAVLPGAAGMRNDFAMCGLPQPDKARFLAEDDGVVPPPDHCLSAIRRRCDSDQVTG